MGILDSLPGLANAALGGMARPIAFTRVTTRPGSDPWEAPAEVKTTYQAKGFVLDYRETQIDGTIIQAGDKKILLLAASCAVKPQVEDLIVSVNSIEQRKVIKHVAEDPAEATYILQVR